MSLSKYYRLFGLPETASEAEIKRKYRQLAMRYHPDKFDGDDSKFIEIKEAYEYLTGKKAVSATQQTYSPTRSTSYARQQSQEERIKQAQQRKRESEYKEYVENERYFQSLITGKKWRFLKLMAYIGLLLTVLLIIDFNLPYRYNYEIVTGYSPVNSEGGGEPVRKIFTESGKSFYVEDMVSVLRTEPEVFLVRSYIFQNEIGFVPMKRMLEDINIEHWTIFHIHFTLGAFSRWLLLFFILPIFVILFKRRTYIFTASYYMALYISCPLILIYIFTNNRWLHLLSFGYL